MTDFPQNFPPDPYVAFLSFMQEARAANGGRPNAFRPGAQGVPGAGGASSDASGAPGGVSGGVAGTGGGGSVPGTATTGPNLLQDIIQGGGSAEDPLAQDLVTRTFLQGHEPGERGDLGAGVTGGSAELLASIATGGVGAIPGIIASLVASDALTGTPDPTFLGATSLADLVLGREGGEPGDFGARASGGEPFSFGAHFGSPVTSATDPFSAALGSVAVDFGPSGSGGLNFNNDRDDDRRSGGPGAGPNRGAPGAGNRGR